MNFHDLLADLPAPRDDEPPSLRDDIADELTDHLQCAYRREVLKDGDESAAEQSVLKRFGNPKKVARRLWWQAMWSRIMGQRILSGLQWMLTLAAVVLAGLVFRQQSELISEIRAARKADAVQQKALTAFLEQVRRVPEPIEGDEHEQGASYYPDPRPSLSQAPPPLARSVEAVDSASDERDAQEWQGAGQRFREESTTESVGSDESQSPQTLTVKLVQETADGPPVVVGMTLRLEGRHGGMNALRLSQPVTVIRMEDGKEISEVVPRATGEHQFQVEHPDRYQLKIRLTDGQSCEQSVLIRPNEHREMTVVCPKPREQAMVYLTAPPLPKELQALKCELEILLNDSVTTIDGIEWHANSASVQRVKFDAQGGQVVEIQNQTNGETTNLRRSKPAERAVVMLSGPVQFCYQLSTRMGEGNTWAAIWPNGYGSLLIHDIAPGENRWELELPEELLTEAKRPFETSGVPVYAPADNSREVPDPVEGAAPGDPPEAKTGPGGKGALLTVKLVEEGEDGSPVTGAKVTLKRFKTTIESHVIGEKTPEGDRLFHHSGKYGFRDLLPDQDYELKVSVPNGQHCWQKIHIEPNEEHELTVICPKPREKTEAYLKAPSLPEDLRRAGAVFGVGLITGPSVLDGRHWYPSNWPMMSVIFDPETGRLKEIEEREIKPGRDGEPQKKDLTQISDLERHVRLFTGPVIGTYVIGFPSSKPEIPGVKWPDDSMDRTEMFTVDNGVNHLELAIPEELIAAARNQIADSKSETVRGLLGAKTETDDEPAVLSVKLVQGNEDGPPVLGAMAELSWGPNAIEQREETRPVQLKHGKDGVLQADLFQKVKGNVFRFTGLKPERYSLRITLLDGQTCDQKVLIRDDKPKELIVVCPMTREKSPVVMSVTPLPDDLRQADFRVWCLLTPSPLELGNSKWLPRDTNSDQVVFEASGRPQSIQNAEFSPETPLEDRVAFLPQGPFGVRIRIYQTTADLSDPSKWPKVPGDEVMQTVQPGENRWELELSDEMLAAARKRLAGVLAPDDSSGAHSPIMRAPPGGSPGAKTKMVDEPLGDQCRLIVKLASETADGPAPNGPVLELRDDSGEFAWVRHENGATAQTGLQLGSDGQCVIGPIDPGRYTLDIRFPDGRRAQKKLPLLRPGQQRTEHIICPPESKKAVVNISVTPVPKELRNPEGLLTGTIGIQRVELEGTVWQLPDSVKTIVFDQGTGLPLALVDLQGHQATDLSQIPPEDRALIVMSGKYEIGCAWRSINPANGLFHKTILDWPQAATIELKPGENEWKVDLSEQFSKLNQ